MTDTLDGKTAPPVQSDGRSKGERTRERLIDLAYLSMIEKGFAATSIEELVEACGITKSGFFYHFKDKTDLARQLIDRYVADNDAFLDDIMARAKELSDDPLHAFLIFVKLFGEALADVFEAMPGCLVATITFQERCFGSEVGLRNREGVKSWRGKITGWLEEVAAAYPPKRPVDLVTLADSLLAITYGGATLTKSLGDRDVVNRQALLYRDTVRMVFG
jgi:TetR/AcrR family transcriptional repressor of nem operon